MGKRRSARPKQADASPPPAPSAGRRGRILALAGSVVALGIAAWLGLARWPGAFRARVNVLLVTIDTLRADHVGCYGAKDAETPVMDALAARGVRFTTAIAHVPLTGPSHASILTGRTPLGHGMRDNGSFALPPSIPTLAEAFHAAGYRTAAFVSGFPLDRRFGLARGFDVYDDRLPHGNDPRRAPYVERPADQTTRAALTWLRSTEPARWFAWVHYFDPHAPYEPPADLATRFAAHPYDGEVAFADRELGELLLGIGADQSGSSTLVLVTSDHGESLGEHGEDTHGVFVYDSTLRVPLVVAGPGVSPRVSPIVARGIDVVPTLLDLAGLPVLAGAEGRSLRPAVRGRAMEDAPAYAESLFARLNLGWSELHAWRTSRFKLIEAPTAELYALDDDPNEDRNVAGGRRDVTDGLRRSLRAALAERPPAAPLAKNAEAAERLRSLGYLGGSAPAAPSLRDPKDAIGLLRRMERGLAEARANPALAEAELTAVLAEEPDMPLARRYRAIACQSAGKYDLALADLHSLERASALGVEDLVLLAETLRLAKRPEEAIAPLDRAAALEPGSPEPLLIKGRVLRSMGRRSEAATAFAAAVALVPGHIEAARALAELAIENGSLEEASGRLEPILARDPDDVETMVKLGVVRVRSGRLEEGLSLFQRAVALDPRHAEALLDLAGALAKSGRAAEAVPYFEKAIEAGGPTTVALNGLGFARLEAGDAAGGEAALKRSLALQPRQPQVAAAVEQLARGRRP